MIQILYTATISQEWIDTEDKDDLYSQIIEGAKEAIENSAFILGNLSYSHNTNLPPDKCIFNVLIHCVPEENFTSSNSDTSDPDAYLEKVIASHLKNDPLFALDDYIFDLKEQSFEGWHTEAKKGYLTACVSIQERIEQLQNKKNP